ncbi:outer membrane lipoprotein-sorting protein [Thermodesulfobacteriota bacterium]
MRNSRFCSPAIPGIARVLLPVCLAVLGICTGLDAGSLSAIEILDECSKRNRVDSFRVGIEVKTFRRKAKAPDEFFFWLMGRTKQDLTCMFVEFREPARSKGLRFLFRFPEDGSPEGPEGYMYMSSTRTTIPLRMAGKSADMGGTGLNMNDFRGFVPSRGGAAKLVGQEKVSGLHCYVIQVAAGAGHGHSKYWISQERYLLVKSQKFSSKGEMLREFRVLSFFRTSGGKSWPREEEILDKRKNARIVIEQVAGAYNILLPTEIFGRATFGTAQWSSLPTDHGD